MADFCEKAGADIREVARGMGLDSRIGRKFLNPGPGYGGSCFPKDTNAMAQMGRKYGAHLNLIETTIAKNDERKISMGKRVIAALNGSSDGRIAVWGLAFKGGTDDCRESPAMEILNEILRHSKNVTVYDPKAMDNARKQLGDEVAYVQDEYEACRGADVLVILTEWEDFKTADLNKIRSMMKTHRILDLRNMLDADAVRAAGFDYSCIGMK